MREVASNSHALSPETTGFTLVELLITITVLATLLILSTPSFKTLLMNNRILAKADALTNALNYARNSALTQNMSVVACPFAAADSTACGTSWQNGWIIVTQPTTGAQILLLSYPNGTNDPVLSSATTSVTFDLRGITTTQANFKLCDDRGGAFARSVKVLPTGFVQSGDTMGSAVWDGSALACP